MINSRLEHYPLAVSGCIQCVLGLQICKCSLERGLVGFNLVETIVRPIVLMYDTDT